MPAPAVVTALVERFARNRDEYQSAHFNEATLCQQFLLPLFKALGWDVHNEQGHAEAYKDVVHQDAIKVGGATKAPDYCFRVGGRRIFFLEAKKPAVNVQADDNPAFQLRRYAWSAKLPLSILSDFEELAVYDCRLKPNKGDKAAVGRILYLTFQQYVEKWDELAAIFSREAVLKGSFDRFAESKKGKRGTAQVDAAFLEEIEVWRGGLARNFALRNPDLSQRDLNFAVQRTIDRIIFLRMCEDRGIEPYGQLGGLCNGEAIYARLCELFERADERSNSGLFHFHQEKGRAEAPDELTTSLMLDDKPLREILRGLYFPDCPYEFSVLPAEILGQVYEQFLGKVIRLTPSHKAVVEDKPEVKKAGGVYYTPSYIVDYIVRQTVGKLVEGQTPKQAAKLRVLDPACGSGSFLVGAYQFLLDWHRDWYLADGAQQHAKAVYQGAGGQWHLTTAEKKRILLNNIYGVDLDSQAVEVTKLSLLLKVLENENQETLERQLRLLHERALPDLGRNIKCGNSLIGPDFYQGRQMKLLDDQEQYRINAFDWQAEFPDILKGKHPGFDAVIGNPPWGQKEIDKASPMKQYLLNKYPSSAGIYDLFRPFVEHAVRSVRAQGKFGMVLPDIVLLKDYPTTRRLLLDQLALDSIDWWGMAFANAVIDAATIIGTRSPASDKHCVRVRVHDPEVPLQHEIRQNLFLTNPRYTFNLYLTPAKRAVLDHLAQFPKLGDVFEIHEGVHSGNIRRELFVDAKLDSSCEEMIFGRGEIAPYTLRWNGAYVRLSVLPRHRNSERYANAGSPDWYHRDKILVRRTGDFVLAAVDRQHRYASNNFFILFPKDEGRVCLDSFCALLNSRFMTWYFRTIEPRKGRVFAELKIKHLSVFPFPKSFLAAGGDPVLRALSCDRAACAVKPPKAATPHDLIVLQRRIAMLDAKIDAHILSIMGVDAAEILATVDPPTLNEGDGNGHSSGNQSARHGLPVPGR